MYIELQLDSLTVKLHKYLIHYETQKAVPFLFIGILILYN